MDNQAKFNIAGVIVAIIVGMIFLQVLFSVAEDTIPTAATAYHNLSDTLAGDAQVIGTDAASFAGDTDDYLGWFWVLGPFILAISLVLGFFRIKGRGNYRRRR